jgi:hypothetical protein
MTLDVAAINYLAVLVVALATFFLGAVWYTALFGKRWVQLQGFTPEQMKAMQARRPPPLFFGGLILCYLVIALVVAMLVVAFNVNNILDGALMGLLLWLGPAAAVAMTGYLSTDKAFGVYLIDCGYQLLYLVLMGAVLGAWR